MNFPLTQGDASCPPRFFSIVIPLLDEAPTLAELHRQIAAVAEQLPAPLEMIFVDDGSTDDGWSVLCQLQERDDRIQLVRLRRNFGKSAALSAGFALARGDVIVTLDADLQDDPAELPRLLAKLAEGFDLVIGWKAQRQDSWQKRLASRVFNGVVSWLSGIRLHDHNSGFKCFRAAVPREVSFQAGMHRFTAVLAAERGFRAAEVPVHHRPRAHGTSKYGWRRLPRGLLDLWTVWFLTRYRERPQHFFAKAGLGALLVGIAGVAFGALRSWWLAGMPTLATLAALLGGFSFLIIGSMLFACGLLAELWVSQEAPRQLSHGVRECRRSPGQTSDFAPPLAR